MVREKLFKVNKFERAEDKVTARTRLIIFDGFMKAIKMINSKKEYAYSLLKQRA